MTVAVMEFAGLASPHPGSGYAPFPQSPALAVTNISSAGSSGAGMSTITFSSNTNLVVITNTVGQFFAQFGSSLLSTLTAATITSTNTEIFITGLVHMRGVLPHSKLIAFST